MWQPDNSHTSPANGFLQSLDLHALCFGNMFVLSATRNSISTTVPSITWVLPTSNCFTAPHWEFSILLPTKKEEKGYKARVSCPVVTNNTVALGMFPVWGWGPLLQSAQSLVSPKAWIFSLLQILFKIWNEAEAAPAVSLSALNKMRCFYGRTSRKCWKNTGQQRTGSAQAPLVQENAEAGHQDQKISELLWSGWKNDMQLSKPLEKAAFAGDPPRDLIAATAASGFLRGSLKSQTEPSQDRDTCRRGQTCTQVTKSMLETSKTIQNKSSSWGCCDLCSYRWVYSKWQKHLNDRVMVSPPKLHFLLHQTLLTLKL